MIIEFCINLQKLYKIIIYLILRLFYGMKLNENNH